MELTFAPFSISGSVTKVFEAMSAAATAKNLKLEEHIAADVPPLLLGGGCISCGACHRQPAQQCCRVLSDRRRHSTERHFHLDEKARQQEGVVAHQSVHLRHRSRPICGGPEQTLRWLLPCPSRPHTAGERIGAGEQLEWSQRRGREAPSTSLFRFAHVPRSRRVVKCRSSRRLLLQLHCSRALPLSAPTQSLLRRMFLPAFGWWMVRSTNDSLCTYCCGDWGTVFVS